MKGKYGFGYTLASASDGPCLHGRGPTVKMEFPHVRFSTLTTDIDTAIAILLAFLLGTGLMMVMMMMREIYLPSAYNKQNINNKNSAVAGYQKRHWPMMIKLTL